MYAMYVAVYKGNIIPVLSYTQHHQDVLGNGGEAPGKQPLVLKGQKV